MSPRSLPLPAPHFDQTVVVLGDRGPRPWQPAFDRLPAAPFGRDGLDPSYGERSTVRSNPCGGYGSLPHGASALFLTRVAGSWRKACEAGKALRRA